MNPAPIQDRAAALAALIEQHRDTPFAWGVHDCCLWSATAVQAQTGSDPAARWRGTYGTRTEARALIEREFGGDIEAIPGACELVEVPVLQARRGFIVSASFKGYGVSLGVCIGSRAAFAGKAGLVFIPMERVRRAWKV